MHCHRAKTGAPRGKGSRENPRRRLKDVSFLTELSPKLKAQIHLWISGRCPKDALSALSVCQFTLDKNYLIDPQPLYVGSKIGEGAHEKVYEGKYRDQSVAVKILKMGETSEERTKLEARFVREIAMMSKVQRKNLVKFIGACKDSIMVIATELLPGVSLQEYMTSSTSARMAAQPTGIDGFLMLNDRWFLKMPMGLVLVVDGSRSPPLMDSFVNFHGLRVRGESTRLAGVSLVTAATV
eukprot:Gb_14607 [translate_table: standard]